MRTLLGLAALALALPAIAQDADEPVTPGSVIAAAAAEEWVAIAPEDLLVMDLAPDAAGDPRRVVIQLMPPPFSQPWVENIRTLARAHWWDGTSINRVQDNYVTQWGDVTEEKPLPEGVVAPLAPYDAPEPPNFAAAGLPLTYQGNPAAQSPTLFGAQAVFRGNRSAEYAAFAAGFPYSGTMDPHRSLVWPIHCYGYVGVGRNVAPDTGTGAELYTIIGQPQRHMDRNLAVVGRVIEGMEFLSSLPRGSGELGFYSEEEAHLRTPIVSVRMGNEISEPPRFEYLDTASESFTRYVRVRANRDDAFYTVPAGGVDVCSVQVPIRRAEAAR